MSTGLCIVTGATRGLGRALTLRLASDGYDVLAMARGRSDLEKLAAECPGPGTVETLVADLADEASLAATLDAIRALPRAATALVNNAATQTFRPTQEWSPAEFASILQVNTVAPFALSAAVIPAMAAAGGGTIVNIASDLAYRPSPNGAAYCASKAAMVAWSQVLQEEQRASGVRVSVVEPGWIATGERTAERVARGDMSPDVLADAIVGLLGMPPEVRVDRLVVHPMVQGTWG
jgi:short-subunit dehydrogenase